MISTLKSMAHDKIFFRRTLSVAVPIMIQNGITNFVSLLDNIMVGRIGTEQMSGVAISNQILMIYFLCIFGGVAGAGIFTAQYYGEGNEDGIRESMRFKIWICSILTLIAVAIFTIFGNSLIGLYLKGSADGGNITATLNYGRQYMNIIMLSLPAFMMLQVYTSTLRECSETVVPMKAGFVAVIVNLALNYILIFGKFGFPALGVVGAAIATVVARYTEATYVILWTHINKSNTSYIRGLYKTLKIPAAKVKNYVVKGLPLLANEACWSGGMASLTQCYSVRGLSVVAGLNIANTIFNVFSIVFIALGDAVAIIVGQLLGAGKMKEARDTDNKLILFSVISCAFISVIMFLVAPLFPNLYNITEQSRHIATQFMCVQALFLPMMAFNHATYFTLRSGGKTMVTFFFDSVYMWAISFVLAFMLSRYTDISAVAMYALVQSADIIKCIIGYVLVKKGVWINNIVSE